jgi:hypothetical protein
MILQTCGKRINKTMKQIFYLLILSLFISACSGRSEKLITASESIQADKAPGECPFLTKDNKGNAVLSWVRIIDDSTTAFCYAITTDGTTFSDPVVIPNSNDIQPHGENMPRIIFKPSGEIIALWGAAHPTTRNKYSGLVSYTQSFDHGKTWTNPKPLVTDTASYDQRYYDIALMPGGEVGVIWLDNRKTTTHEGSGLFLASTSGQNGFGGGRLISQPCCQCCRTDLYVDKKGSMHAIYRAIINDSIRDMVHIVSTDGGKTFSAPKRINEDNWVLNGCPHTGPAMTENNEGIHFSWFTGGEKHGCYYAKTINNGASFVMHDSVSVMGTHPQLASLGDGDLVIAWDETHVNGNKVLNQIGVQRRSADGKAIAKKYITPEESFASFPVIAPISKTSCIIAYSTKKEGKNYVAYQVVDMK